MMANAEMQEGRASGSSLTSVRKTGLGTARGSRSLADRVVNLCRRLVAELGQCNVGDDLVALGAPCVGCGGRECKDEGQQEVHRPKSRYEPCSLRS